MRPFSMIRRSATRMTAIVVSIVFAAGCGGDGASPEPAIEVDDASVVFDVEEGSGPSMQHVEVTSPGAEVTDLGVTVTYPASGATGWLTASLSDETTPSTLMLMANPGTTGGPTLAMGTHTASVVITGENTNTGPVMIGVEMRVAGLSGYSTPFTSSIDFATGMVLAMPVTVASNVALASVNVHLNSVTSGAVGKFAVYSNHNNAPSAVVASTQPMTLVAGRNEFPLTGPLSAGTYWLGFTVDKTVSLAASAAAYTPIRYTSHTFANAFPTPTSWSSNDAPAMNFFLKHYAP